MAYIKSKSNENLFSKNIENAKSLIKEVTGEEIIDGPEIYFYSAFEKNLKAIGFQTENRISISQELLEHDKKTADFVFYHEFFHWAIRQLGNGFNGNHFYDVPNFSQFAFPFRFTLVKTMYKNNNKIRVNFLEEGTCDLFAATLISENKNEIPKNMFYLQFFQEPYGIKQFISNAQFQIRRKIAIREVYSTIREINGFTADEINKIIDENKIKEIPISKLNEINKDIEKMDKVVIKCAEHFSCSPEAATCGFHQVGKLVDLFAYEIYKKEGKDEKQLLKDLINSPWDVVEKVAKEIKEDEKEELLKNVLLDTSLEFEGLLRYR